MRFGKIEIHNRWHAWGTTVRIRINNMHYTWPVSTFRMYYLLTIHFTGQYDALHVVISHKKKKITFIVKLFNATTSKGVPGKN